MASNQSYVSVKPLSGMLSRHFVFIITADSKVEDCVHCNKQFAFCGSNTSLTYYFQHKHPLQYHDVVASDRQRSSQIKSITSFLSCQSNKPISDKVSTDLKVGIIQLLWKIKACKLYYVLLYRTRLIL